MTKIVDDLPEIVLDTTDGEMIQMLQTGVWRPVSDPAVALSHQRGCHITILAERKKIGLSSGFECAITEERKAIRRVKFFNKKGDRGITSLRFGHRVPKHSPRPEAYGVIDEANSALGLARALVSDTNLKPLILDIQQELFLLGSELAVLSNEASKLKDRVSEAHVLKLEQLIEDYEKRTNIPRAFVPPGGTPGAGALDLARSIIRRAERRIVKLFEDNEIENPHVLSYCNRLADLLFTLARYEESSQGRTTPSSPPGSS